MKLMSLQKLALTAALVSRKAALLSLGSALLSLSSAVVLTSSVAQAGSAFDYINTPELTSTMKHFYYKSVATNVQRKKIIAAAKEECGGRYEGTELTVTELSHEIFLDKAISHGVNPGDYTMTYKANNDISWLVVENIKCSMHGGHNRSVLHARFITGKETMNINYVYVGDVQLGTETVTNLKRLFTLGATTMTAKFKTPYGTVVP